MKRLRTTPRVAFVLLALAIAFGIAGCTQQSASSGGAAAPEPAPAANPAPDKPADEPKQPAYKSWTVYINDDDSYSEGNMTYKVAVNITATNPSQDVAGTYKGNATASTTTQGTVNGMPLDAQAVAQSGNLEFTLQDPAGPELAQLTPENWKLSGTGTITMKASGHVSVGPAGGGYGNTSSQNLQVSVDGTKVTLKVGISGHTYTFDGTISGNE